MAIRQSVLVSPLRVVAAAILVILVFALLYPFAGFSETVSQTDVTITYVLETSDLSEPKYAANVLAKSLHLSVQTFTLTGASGYTTVSVGAMVLAGLESLLGMGFLALFTASLLRDE